MKINIIGCGEVGQCYARSLSEAGHQLINLCDARDAAPLRELARRHGAALRAGPGSWLADGDLTISAVYGGEALQVARSALAQMAPGSMYADFTTASPEHMREAAQAAARAGVGFADVAIVGAIGVQGGATPLLCAGDAAEDVAALMRAAGAPVRTVGPRAGDAASLKLLRSIFTKGVEALAVECLVAAEQKGLRETLYEVLSDVDAMPLRQFMESCVRSHVVHARRRLAEVQEAKRQMRNEALNPLALDGVESLFQRTADALQAHPPSIPDTIAGSLQWLRELAAAKPGLRG